MRILFVIRDIYLFERFGIMHISSMLKTHRHEVDILKTMGEDIQAKIKSFRPHILAYSVTTGFHQYYVDINRKIKERHKALSVFGGPHPTFFPDMINEEGVDAVCIGEGELPMLDLANALNKREPIEDIKNLIIKTNGNIKSNSTRDLVQDLDTLPFPDRELLYQNSPILKNMKVKTFFSGRGCPYKCSYCFNHKYNALFKNKGKIIRKRSVDNLLREILQVKNNYPMEIVWFMDDVFTLGNREWLNEFSQKYKKMIGLPFVCMTRADLIDEKIVKLLKDAGCCSVYMAIEAGNDRIRNDLLNRKLTKTQMTRASRLFHEYGIKIVAENILGLPSESLEDMFETLQLNITCKIDCCIASIFTPYPGTELARFAQENGYFSGDYDKVASSFFSDSSLSFTRRQKRKISNLRHLFNITVNFPCLLPLTKLLINLPSNRVFSLLSDLWHGYCLKFKIFPYKSTFKEHVCMIKAFLKRNKA